MNPPKTAGPIMPACTTARGNMTTLYRGRDGSTRYAPPPPPKPMMRDAAKVAAMKT